MLHRNGSKITGLFRNGQEIRTLYKNGVIIYDKQGEPVFYTLTYDWDGGYDGPENLTTSVNEVSVSEQTPSHDGYFVFDHWEDVNSESWYYPGDLIALPADLCAYYGIQYEDSWQYRINEYGSGSELIPPEENADPEAITKMFEFVADVCGYFEINNEICGTITIEVRRSEGDTLEFVAYGGEGEEIVGYLQQIENDIKIVFDSSLYYEGEETPQQIPNDETFNVLISCGIGG